MLNQNHPAHSAAPLAAPRRPVVRGPVDRRGLWLSRIRLILCGLAFGGGLTAIHVVITGQLPFLHRENVWSIAIYESDSPLRPPRNLSPSLTADDVTDVDAAFVADPFMIQRDSRWYLFCEVLNQETGQGDIGVATRGHDGRWQYQQIVLDEPFHLSYPDVFVWQDHVYMVPESEAAGEVRLYEATEFPFRWRLKSTLLRRPHAADPTLFRFGDRWWMFLGRSGTHDQLSLYFSDRLDGSWVEHPQSPIMENDRKGARPGGRVIRIEDRLLRFGQDCRSRYGHQLFAFEITQLTPTAYSERPLSENPMLRPGRSAWNNYGMHHCDLHATRAGRWIASVDGHTKQWRLSLWPH